MGRRQSSRGDSRAPAGSAVAEMCFPPFGDPSEGEQYKWVNDNHAYRDMFVNARDILILVTDVIQILDPKFKCVKIGL